MKLKPCPFCGSSVSLEGGPGGEHYIVCMNTTECGCVPFYGMPSEVVKWWNRRAESVERRRTVRPKRAVQQLKADVAALIPALVEGYNHMRDEQHGIAINKLRQLSAV